jgi:hypothetical protein
MKTMKTQGNGRKLRVARETVRSLTAANLGDARGASDDTLTTINTQTGSWYACTDCTSMRDSCRICLTV